MLALRDVQAALKVIGYGASVTEQKNELRAAGRAYGVVYDQDSPSVMERVKDKFDIRAQKP